MFDTIYWTMFKVFEKLLPTIQFINGKICLSRSIGAGERRGAPLFLIKVLSRPIQKFGASFFSARRAFLWGSKCFSGNWNSFDINLYVFKHDFFCKYSSYPWKSRFLWKKENPHLKSPSGWEKARPKHFPAFKGSRS